MSRYNDDRYDEIKDHLRAIDKKNAYFKRVGADVDNKVKLPYYLGSQDKIKDDPKILNKWIQKYNNPKSYIISEKLDGISCLVVYKNGDIKIYTRGDGYYGQDITHIKDYISGIISIKTQKQDIVVRGELIISRENWEKIKHEGSNARNLVAGLINSKILKKDLLKFIDFVVYEIIEGSSLNLDDLKKFNVVKHKEVKDLSIEFLYDLYKEWKDKSKYEIDGLIIKHNSTYKLKVGENPKYSFAFKSLNMHRQVEVVVNDIEWNVSKDKYLLSKSSKGEWQWKNFGKEGSLTCDGEINEYGYLNCNGSEQISFNKKNLRFMLIYKVGYLNKGILGNEGEDTPRMDIGTCSPL
jgi:NAD-dependent DNA ligase